MVECGTKLLLLKTIEGGECFPELRAPSHLLTFRSTQDT
jgi:hypothetical protein